IGWQGDQWRSNLRDRATTGQVRIGMWAAKRVEHGKWSVGLGCREIFGGQRDFSVAAGDVEDVSRLGNTRKPLPERADEGAAVRYRCAEMRRSGREIRVVQVIRLHAVLDEGPHQR